jgi:hypothetical protein
MTLHIKLKKNWWNCDVILNAHAFFQFITEICFCLHIADNANIAENVYYRRNLLATIDDIDLRVVR